MIFKAIQWFLKKKGNYNMKITIRQLKQLIREQVEEAMYLDVNTGEFYDGNKGEPNEEQVENKPAKKWKDIRVFDFSTNKQVKSDSYSTLDGVVEQLRREDPRLTYGDTERGPDYELVTLEGSRMYGTLVVVGSNEGMTARKAFNLMGLS
jgi:predicted MPP superfamily phosphohydrolase